MKDHIYIDNNLKKDVGLILEKLGLTHEEVIKLLYTQIKLWNKIPFDIEIPSKIHADNKNNENLKNIMTITNNKAFTGTKPKKLMIGEKSFTVFKWIEVFKIICEDFYKKDFEKFKRVIEDRVFHTSIRDIFSFSADSKKIDKVGIIGENEDTKKEIFFNRTLSTSDILKYLKLVIEKYEYEEPICFSIEQK